jgi:hypothetical protein
MKLHSPDHLRSRLVASALEWEAKFGVAPAITSAVSEYDAALLVGLSLEEYGTGCVGRTAVSRGHDFIFRNYRYQVKANRPSGKPSSRVTLVSKPKNYDWDFLIWILYDRSYQMQEAWLWSAAQHKLAFASKNRLCPDDMRRGKCLYPEPVRTGVGSKERGLSPINIIMSVIGQNTDARAALETSGAPFGPEAVAGIIRQRSAERR